MKWIFLIIGFVATVHAAPAEVNSSLYKFVVNDSRLEKLRANKFVAECKRNSEFSKSLCIALVDIFLEFNEKSLEFTKINATYPDGEFCKALTQVFPDTPANKDSNTFKEVEWFKDILKKEDGEDVCSSHCIYEDKLNYEFRVLPACQFLLNQYSFLKSTISASGSQEKPKRELKL